LEELFKIKTRTSLYLPCGLRVIHPLRLRNVLSSSVITLWSLLATQSVYTFILQQTQSCVYIYELLRDRTTLKELAKIKSQEEEDLKYLENEKHYEEIIIQR